MHHQSPVPVGYSRVMPCLKVDRAVEAIDFYQRVFGAVECVRFEDAKGSIGYAELSIGEATIMLGEDADTKPDEGSSGNTRSSLYVFVEDVDGVVQKARDAGAHILEAPEDQFYGDRTASFMDPYGHSWRVATHFENVSVEELKSRGAVYGMILKKFTTMSTEDKRASTVI